MAGCPKWTNNACESINHVLKQRLQWRVHMLPELIEQLRKLVDSQFIEADRAVIGRGDLALHPDYARHRLTFDVWRTMSIKQRNRARDDCFRLPSRSDGTTTSTSTDGDLTVNYRSGAGKKLNQRKRARADRTRPY
jgi:hypothetical protein